MPNDQLSLFDGRDLLSSPSIDPKTLAARGDPQTSLEAASLGESSGTFGRQRDVVLRALREHPDTTPCELAKRSGLERFMVSRRLADLSRLGLATRGAARICTEAGTRQHTWRAAT